MAVLFPGQGSQSLGMASRVLRVYAQAHGRFQTASDLLGYDLLKLMERGPLENLDDTEYSQPAIYTASVAWYDALRAKWGEAGRPLRPVAMAGQSMGQITAFVAGEALDFEHGLRLVQARGEVMREAAGPAARRDGLHHWPARPGAAGHCGRGGRRGHAGGRQRQRPRTFGGLRG